MPYIGNDIQYGELNSQTFTGDGSTTAFTLTYTVSNVNSLLVTVADVIQEPTTAYTVSGTTLTFTSAPANLDTIHVRYLGRTLDVGTTAIVQDSDQDTLIQVEESADEDTIRFDTGGTERVTINSTSVTSTIPLYIPDGSASTPSVTNTGDTNTGIFFPAADTVGVAVGGTEVWRYGSNPTTAKNLIINGAMRVAQRGTLTGLGAAQAYTSADMWKLFIETTAARVTTSVETAPAAMIADGFANALKIDVTTVDSSPADSDFIGVEQRFEGQNLQHLLYGTAGAKELTVSFWFQSPKSGTHIVYLVQNDGNYGCPMQFTVASADTAEKFSVTFPALTTAGQDFDDDANFSMALGFPLMSNGYESTANQWNSGGTWRSTSAQQNLVDNTANDIYIAGVQLEVGSVATDFEHEDYGTTLAKCQRYVWVVPTVNGDYICMGLVGSSTSTLNLLPLPVTMRAVPTLALSAGTHFGCIEIGVATRATTALSLDGASSEQLAVLAATVSSSGMATGEATILSSASASATMLLTAEL
jgi:hypothetical protein